MHMLWKFIHSLFPLFSFISIHLGSFRFINSTCHIERRTKHEVASHSQFLHSPTIWKFPFCGKEAAPSAFLALSALAFLFVLCRLCPWQLSCHQCFSLFVSFSVPFWPWQCTFTTALLISRSWVLSWSTGALHAHFFIYKALPVPSFVRRQRLSESSCMGSNVALFFNLFICQLMNIFKSASDELLLLQSRKRHWMFTALHCNITLKDGSLIATCNPSFFFLFNVFFAFSFCQKYCDIFVCKLQVADCHFRIGAF